MTQPACVDPAFDVITAFITALKEGFDPNSDCPPDGGGGTDVRFFAGDAAPTSAWDAHTNSGADCTTPFLWVRVVRRFRSKEFPAPAVVTSCELPRVIEVEIGVARCAIADQDPSWEDYAKEAEISLDDSWRIELALCRARGLLSMHNYRVGTDTIVPFGPEGGIIAWSGVAFVQF